MVHEAMRHSHALMSTGGDVWCDSTDAGDKKYKGKAKKCALSVL